MAVYDYATTFTQLLQQKYAKELCSDALTQSNMGVKFISAQTIKLPRMAVKEIERLQGLCAELQEEKAGLQKELETYKVEKKPASRKGDA